MSIERDIMNLPAEAQLPAAMAIINELCGEGEEEKHWRQTLGLSNTQARMFTILYRNRDRWVTALAIATAGYPENPEHGCGCVRSQMWRLRDRIADFGHINNRHGVGYQLVMRRKLPEYVPPVTEEIAVLDAFQPWSKQDARQVVTLAASGKSVVEISEIIGRSADAVIAKLKSRGFGAVI